MAASRIDASTHPRTRLQALSEPRPILRVLLPLACFIFLATHVIASFPYYSGKRFDPMDAVISYIESPKDNPHGFGIAAAGTAICGFLLLPAANLLRRRLGVFSRRGARLVTVVFGAGLLFAVAIGVLAPFPSLWDVHVALAYAIFIALTCGMLLTAALLARAGRGSRMRALALWNGGILLFLTYLLLVPGEFFKNTRFYNSLAAFEWALCVWLATSIYVVVRELSR